MKKYTFLLMALAAACCMLAQRRELPVKNWQFAKETTAQQMPEKGWQNVCVPHDWAISGPFDRANDLQTVAVTQNGETTATEKTARSGGLPWMGSAWYKTTIHLDEAEWRDGVFTLYFDGAMADPHVYVNGELAGFWHYGYNAFTVDITRFVHSGDNQVAVRLENLPQSSRWYPGAGLYREVRLIRTNKIHVPVWGTYITTPYVSEEMATVRLLTKINVPEGTPVRVRTTLFYHENNDPYLREMPHFVGEMERTYTVRGGEIQQNFKVEQPRLWSPDAPNLYYAQTQIYAGDEAVDVYTTEFGIRKIEYVAEKGFLLNGKPMKFKGVCLHHDLGPLGAAVSRDAIRHQLTMLKDMGCNAIRTSHNMPCTELVELCDEMGFMMMVEPFDEWQLAKCENGYHRYFSQVSDDDREGAGKTWGEREMINMLHHFRNYPCVVMWSIGNEVPEQNAEDGAKVATFLQDICHREDPTRPVTCGMDQVGSVIYNGFADVIDIPGFNYRTGRYEEAYSRLPQQIVLGSETASTVSSRGIYKLPAEIRPDVMHPDHQCSGYDVEYCSWSGLPDQDFRLADDFEWEIGQFVWTGFDYLGEPYPYDTDAWPSHSSVFGIIDLASLPKDRYYLYRSQWNTESPTLHLVAPLGKLPQQMNKMRPHAPVMVYTSYAGAELFVDGHSMGTRYFGIENDTLPVGDFELASWGSAPRPDLLPRYRLIWADVPADANEYKVVALDKNGQAMATEVRHRAGKPHHLHLEWANREEVSPDSEGLRYLTVSVVDKDGNLCMDADDLIRIKVKGCTYMAGANGDAACLDAFQKPEMHAFAGQCTFIVRAQTEYDKVTVSAKGMKSATFTF